VSVDDPDFGTKVGAAFFCYSAGCDSHYCIGQNIMRHHALTDRISHQPALGIVLICLSLSVNWAAAQESSDLRGDPLAIADAVAMVETMGGMAIWCDLKSVHFVHEWDLANRHDRYLENEILDLTGPRSYVTMESEVYSRVRAYSPEHRYWSVSNGEFSYGSDEALANAMERAPYSIYRLARAVACGDDELSVRFGTIDSIPGPQALEFVGPDGKAHGWVLLNARNEPIIWATTQYVYVFGPLRRFGNLLVPDWATTSNGLVRYEMVSLTGLAKQPDLTLFAPPEQFRK